MQPITWNADAESLADGARRARVGVKWKNFLSPTGWQPINLAPRSTGNIFAVTSAPFAVELPLLASDWGTLESTNTYDIWTKQPRSDAKCGIQKRYPAAAPVTGFIFGTRIHYPAAFPDIAADRIVELHEQEVRDLVIFSAEPPPGPIAVPFEVDFGTLPILESVGRGQPAVERDFRADRTITEGLSFTTGRFRGLKIKSPRIWDSSGKQTSITIVGRVVGTRFVGKKVLPRAFFKNAVYPVYADTTATFYPDPDPESTTVDGFSERAFDSTWASIRGGNGNSADSASDFLTAGIYASTTTNQWENIRRAILLFDASVISDAATIGSASLNLKATGKEDHFTASLVVVASSPAANTAIAMGDYQTMGTTAFSSPAAISGISTGSYASIGLNATGLAAISLTGVTKLGLRVEADRANSEPTWTLGDQSFVDFSSADAVGTSSDPYLEVNYSGGDGNTVAPAGAIFGGQPIFRRFRPAGY